MTEMLRIWDWCGQTQGYLPAYTRPDTTSDTTTAGFVRTPEGQGQEFAGVPAPAQAPSAVAGVGGVGVLEREPRTVAAPSWSSRRGRSSMWIAFAGALAYNSWPLAFLVNPSLAGSALASSFEARSEPFSWLFILLDCVAGLCAGVVCVRELRPRRGRLRPPALLVFALLGYGLFGLATAVDAVVPLSCGATSAQACASRIWPPTPDDFLTALAIFTLLVAAVAVIFVMTRRPVAFPSSVPFSLVVTLIGWSALGLMVLLWSSSGTMAAASQYAYITLTSVLAFVVPLGVASLQRRLAIGLVPEDS